MAARGIAPEYPSRLASERPSWYDVFAAAYNDGRVLRPDCSRAFSGRRTPGRKVKVLMIMKYAQELRVLCDPTRMKIIELLAERNYCVGALAGMLGISAPAVSQHLKILQSAGLVSGEKVGYHTHYVVDRELLRRISAEIAALADAVPAPCSKRGGRCGADGFRRCMGGNGGCFTGGGCRSGGCRRMRGDGETQV
jgi:ArsR family transcriptional regulator